MVEGGQYMSEADHIWIWSLAGIRTSSGRSGASDGNSSSSSFDGLAAVFDELASMRSLLGLVMEGPAPPGQKTYLPLA